MSASVDIATAFTDANLLGASFPDLSTWETWLSVLKAAFGQPLSRKERRAFETISGGRKSPRRRVRELWALLGRRSGKSRVAAALAVYAATLVDHSAKLSPGEIGMVLVLAASRSQASVVFEYARGALELSSPLLSELIESITSDEIRLTNGIVIAIHAASYRTVRGRTLVGVIFDECAFWRDETGAMPDREIYRAVLPALATTGGFLVGISSPYRARGLLHERFRDFFGKDDGNVLVVKGATEVFNPTIDKDVVAQARKDDPEASKAEWDGEFRTDSSALLDDETIDGAIEQGRPLELPPRGFQYTAFVDASAGRHDAFTIGIAHREEERIVVDLVRGRKPPFDPASVAAEFAGVAKAYRCTSVIGDNFSGEWVKRAFENAGMAYRLSEKPKSALYLESVAVFARGHVSLPNYAPLIRELRLLERRVSRSGKDVVDHPQSGSDDYCNAAIGAIVNAVGGTTMPVFSVEASQAFAATMSQRFPHGPGFAPRPTTCVGWS